MQPLPPAPPLLGRGVVLLALEANPVAFGQGLDGLGEVERLGLLHEADGVAADAAAEAVVEPALGIDRERRRALVVERTEPRPARPDPAEVGLRADELGHVDRVAHPLDRILGEERHSDHSRLFRQRQFRKRPDGETIGHPGNPVDHTLSI